jgi:hypothetical protein
MYEKVKTDADAVKSAGVTVKLGEYIVFSVKIVLYM